MLEFLIKHKRQAYYTTFRLLYRVQQLDYGHLDMIQPIHKKMCKGLIVDASYRIPWPHDGVPKVHIIYIPEMARVQ